MISPAEDMPSDLQTNWPQLALFGAIAGLFLLFFLINAIRGPRPVAEPRIATKEDAVRAIAAIVAWIAIFGMSLVAAQPWKAAATAVAAIALVVGVIAGLRRSPKTNFAEWSVLLAPLVFLPALWDDTF